MHYSQSITLASASVKEGLHDSTVRRLRSSARLRWAGDDGDGSRRPGSQTLARGLSALQLVASSPTGLTVAQVADDIGVHRTIAYRLLSTLAQFRFVVKGEDGRYRSAAALAVLGASFDNNVRQMCVPTLRGLADELGTTVSLLVAEGDQQVAIAVMVPTNVFYQLSFHEGSRYPLERGAAGIALLASMPPRPGERDLVPRTRQQGWVDHPRRDRTQHLWPGGAGAPQATVTTHLHQSDLAPGRRRRARSRLSHQGGQRVIGDPQLRITGRRQR